MVAYISIEDPSGSVTELKSSFKTTAARRTLYFSSVGNLNVSSRKKRKMRIRTSKYCQMPVCPSRHTLHCPAGLCILGTGLRGFCILWFQRQGGRCQGQFSFCFSSKAQNFCWTALLLLLQISLSSVNCSLLFSPEIASPLELHHALQFLRHSLHL